MLSFEQHSVPQQKKTPHTRQIAGSLRSGENVHNLIFGFKNRESPYKEAPEKRKSYRQADISSTVSLPQT